MLDVHLGIIYLWEKIQREFCLLQKGHICQATHTDLQKSHIQAYQTSEKKVDWKNAHNNKNTVMSVPQTVNVNS